MTVKINPAIFATLTGPVAELVAVMAENAAATSEAGAANKERSGTLADKLRNLARVTAQESISTEEAMVVYRAIATGAELKKGTINGYGASFAGFRKLLDEGKDIDAYNVKAAQDAVASEETKAKREAQKRLRAAIKGWKAAEIAELAAIAEQSTRNDDDATSEEREEVTAEAVAA